jgi:hypothetical protein
MYAISIFQLFTGSFDYDNMYECSQPNVMLLFPPGGAWTFTEVLDAGS